MKNYSYAGTCPNGCIERYASDFWSSGPINHASYGKPASSRAHRTLRSRTRPRAKVGTQRKALIVIIEVLRFFFIRLTADACLSRRYLVFVVLLVHGPRPRRLRRGLSAPYRGIVGCRREYRARVHTMSRCAAPHQFVLDKGAQARRFFARKFRHRVVVFDFAAFFSSGVNETWKSRLKSLANDDTHLNVHPIRFCRPRFRRRVPATTTNVTSRWAR